jgi:hypothetical protein
MMKTFDLNFVRIEHKTYNFSIVADNEESAIAQAELMMESSDFDWDDYEINHAEEFWL